jgi:hypothetical protein
MTWMDNLIFALAPLGIITALVGAIRGKLLIIIQQDKVTD